ncbi:MAG: PQQ-like beta-propeller repeat protein [Acidobacteria bacterium]|nr:PQQ-like beta-propeller repeat protein [Acidobacteriota bacterium]MCA1648945.1 PQQ-like beta-propeller repeat protein [Acidobacteriota bacterium]
MFRRILKTTGIVVVSLLTIGLVLYLFGLRVVLDGGGSPYLRFVESADARAAAIARHRESQRVQPAAPAPAAGPTAAVVAPAAPSSPPAETASSAPYWTDFRGPRRDGHYRERPVRTSWPAQGLTPVWKQPVGGGYASFVVAGGRAFTIEQRADQEVVAAYDVPTGREVWTNQWPAKFSELLGGDGPRATPTWSDGRVYALGAQGELRCLDEATGRVVWRINILEDNAATNLQWGMAASPLIVDDTVVVLPGGPNGRSVVAYDRRTGARVWSALDDRQAYSSPMLVTLGGVRQIVVLSASRLMGLTPENGRLLWEHPWVTQFDINAAQPLVVGPDRVFISSGYGVGAAVLELARSGDAFTVREVWRNIRMKNQFTSSVLHEGFVYGLDEAILACVNVASGDLKWKGGRYGYGQVMLASGHLIVLTEDGDMVLVRATPERHEELVRFPVLDGKTWNHPAMAGGYLLVRNLKDMAAFDLRPPSP